MVAVRHGKTACGGSLYSLSTSAMNIWVSFAVFLMLSRT